MTTYLCERCGRQYAEPWCDKDQRELTRVVDSATPPGDEVADAIARQSA